jgi:hypothetical protein
MKAIIEIELEIDGEWKNSDKQRLIEMILESPGNGIWEIDEDRLVVLAKAMMIRIRR